MAYTIKHNCKLYSQIWDFGTLNYNLWILNIFNWLYCFKLILTLKSILLVGYTTLNICIVFDVRMILVVTNVNLCIFFLFMLEKKQYLHKFSNYFIQISTNFQLILDREAIIINDNGLILTWNYYLIFDSYFDWIF